MKNSVRHGFFAGVCADGGSNGAVCWWSSSGRLFCACDFRKF
ncbi:MAG: hypothetical protein PUA64_09295 [Treponema sp.]|nr:hypothetical protein [Treponema sp.]